MEEECGKRENWNEHFTILLCSRIFDGRARRARSSVAHLVGILVFQAGYEAPVSSQ